jgi:hypothetical protein
MAKSIFINGTRVLSKWLNSIYGGGAKDTWAAATVYAAGDVIKLSGGQILRAKSVTGDYKSGATQPTAPGALRDTVVDNNVTWELYGGHLHDGSAIDGSAPRVLLTGAAEVTGVLPAANVVNPFGDTLDYEEGIFNVVFPYPIFTAEKTMAAAYRILKPITTGIPYIVTVWLSGITGTSNATGFITTDHPIPSNARPSTDLIFKKCKVWDNGALVEGTCEITLAGDVIFRVGDNTNFTASGTKGSLALAMEYPKW